MKEAVDSLSAFQRDSGGVLRALRESRLLTQQQLADGLSECLGRRIDQSAVSRMETNARRIKGKELIAVCQVLKCDFKQLYEVATHLEALKAKIGGTVS